MVDSYTLRALPIFSNSCSCGLHNFAKVPLFFPFRMNFNELSFVLATCWCGYSFVSIKSAPHGVRLVCHSKAIKFLILTKCAILIDAGNPFQRLRWYCCLASLWNEMKKKETTSWMNRSVKHYVYWNEHVEMNAVKSSSEVSDARHTRSHIKTLVLESLTKILSNKSYWSTIKRVLVCVGFVEQHQQQHQPQRIDQSDLDLFRWCR